MTSPEDRPRRENDYLGDQSAPTDLAELKEELWNFLTVTEMQVGSMNLFSTEGFLNEQPPVYQSILIRRITKAFRERNTRFFRDLATALTNTDHPALISKTARQLIQSASALSQKGDPVVDSILEKLRNPQWLARASRKKVRALEAKLLRRLAIHSTDTAEKTQAPTQPDVVKHWEKRIGKSRYEINVPREVRAAKLELPKGKSGRPRRKKHAGHRRKY